MMMPVIFAGFALLPLTARADNNPIGTVVAIEGTATLSHDGNKNAAAANMAVYENDTLETGKKSKICIIFIDNTWFILGENAQLTVDDYVYDPDSTKDNKGRFSVPQGAFSYVSGQLDKNRKPDVAIMTGFGSIGIRGTKVLGGNYNGLFGIFDQAGNIDVSTEDGTVNLGPGFGSDLSDITRPPGPTNKWTEDKIKHFLHLVEFTDPGALAALIAALEKDNNKHHHHHHHDNPGADHLDDTRGDVDPDFFNGGGGDLGGHDFTPPIIINGGGGCPPIC